jgi:hypothetical protein
MQRLPYCEAGRIGNIAYLRRRKSMDVYREPFLDRSQEVDVIVNVKSGMGPP